jgi:hypothetical protein
MKAPEEAKRSRNGAGRRRRNRVKLLRNGFRSDSSFTAFAWNKPSSAGGSTSIEVEEESSSSSSSSSSVL